MIEDAGSLDRVFALRIVGGVPTLEVASGVWRNAQGVLAEFEHPSRPAPRGVVETASASGLLGANRCRFTRFPLGEVLSGGGSFGGADGRPPQITRTGDFSYPEFARRASIEGRVSTVILFDEYGYAADYRVTESSGNDLLDDHVITEVRASRFEPAECYGEPVEAVGQITQTYRLR